MKVILTENVKTLGNVGEIVNVSSGHARNYLIPNKLAAIADESNTKQMEDHQKRLAKRVAEQKAAAEAIASKLGSTTITLIKKVGGNGTLFGTVTNTEISKALAAQDIEVEKRLITVETPIKTLGEHSVAIKLFKGVETELKIKVEADPKQLEELKKKAALAAEAKKAQAEAAKAANEAEAAAAAEGEETSEEEA